MSVKVELGRSVTVEVSVAVTPPSVDEAVSVVVDASDWVSERVDAIVPSSFQVSVVVPPRTVSEMTVSVPCRSSSG